MASLLQAITNDHNEIYSIYANYSKNHGSYSVQDQLFNELIWQIARHSVGEELVVYPLYEKYLGAEGKEFTRKEKSEHEALNGNLLLILKSKPEERTKLLDEFITRLKQHTREEQELDLPSLESAIGRDESIKAAGIFTQTKYFAPTRSYSGAPPFANIESLLIAPTNKLKDLLSKLPSDGTLSDTRETRKQN